MILKSKQLALLIFALSLTACNVPESSTPAPTPQAIQVFYPAALEPWADKMAACAAGNPLVALYFLPPPIQPGGLNPGDILLSLGETKIFDSTYYFSQVGIERIILVVHQDNEIEQLSAVQVNAIFSGKMTRWEQGSGKPIQVWVLPPGDAVRLAFDFTVLPTESPTTHAMLAPYPLAVLEAVAGDDSAIGYLPESVLETTTASLTDQVRNLHLPTELESALTLPVVAISLGEPRGLSRDLLVCLQSTTP